MLWKNYKLKWTIPFPDQKHFTVEIYKSQQFKNVKKHTPHYYFNVWSSRLMTLKLNLSSDGRQICIKTKHSMVKIADQSSERPFLVHVFNVCLLLKRKFLDIHTRATKIMKIHSKSPSHFKAHRQSMQLMLRSYILRIHQ